MTQPPLASMPSSVRRVAFMGTPAAAVPTLKALVAEGYDVPVVITRPDRRRGRGSTLVPSPVKAGATELGLSVSHDPDDVLDRVVDLAVVVAYGRLLPRRLLEAVPMINVHFSLLPRWRGAAPVERAILAGDRTTGVCIMGITEGLDEGPIHGCVETEIGDDETSAELTARLADLGARLLVDVLGRDLTDPVPQSGPTTHAGKIDRSGNQLDFDEHAVDLHRQVRIGRAWTMFRGERLGIESTRVVHGTDDGAEPGSLHLVEIDGDKSAVVATGEGRLQLLSVKPAGKRAMTALDWWNGVQPAAGERLGR